MATITNAKLARQITERLRPRCETFVGLRTILTDDIAAITAVAQPEAATVLDDAEAAPIDFTGAHWAAYLAVIQASLAAAQQEAVLAAVQSAVVRPLDCIIATICRSISRPAITDPATRLLAERIRPRARIIRGLRYLMNDDVRIFSALIDPAWDNADVIEEGRGDGVSNVSVGALRVVVAYEAAMIGAENNTEAAAQAIDAACGAALEVVL